jgi:hypothetical protein
MPLCSHAFLHLPAAAQRGPWCWFGLTLAMRMVVRPAGWVYAGAHLASEMGVTPENAVRAMAATQTAHSAYR